MSPSKTINIKVYLDLDLKLDVNIPEHGSLKFLKRLRDTHIKDILEIYPPNEVSLKTRTLRLPKLQILINC